MKILRFEMQSLLQAEHLLVSCEILTMSGVNYELFPFAKMTAPGHWKDKPISEWPIGKNLFASVILLFGLIPVDFHIFGLQHRQNTGFQEVSTSFVNQEWKHHRTISQQDSGCLVIDVVEYIPKVSFLGKLMQPIYQLIFRHRHKRLKVKYKANSL